MTVQKGQQHKEHTTHRAISKQVTAKVSQKGVKSSHQHKLTHTFHHSEVSESKKHTKHSNSHVYGFVCILPRVKTEAELAKADGLTEAASTN